VGEVQVSAMRGRWMKAFWLDRVRIS